MAVCTKQGIRKCRTSLLCNKLHIYIFILYFTGCACEENSTVWTLRSSSEDTITEDVAFTSNHSLNMSQAEVGVTIAILFLIMLVSLTGNILVILSYLISKRLRSYAHLLILNLAISDLCITCLSLPLRICQLFGVDWSDGFTSCSVNVAFTIFFFTASNINLFLVTLDRYLGVIHPVKYRAKGSRKKVKVAIVIAWIISFTIGFFPLTGVGQGKKGEKGAKFICTFATVLHGGYVSFVTIGTLVIPWLLMIAMYSRVLRVGLSSVQTGIRSKERLREEGQPMPEKTRKREQRKMRKRAHELRLARAVLLVLTLYTICLVPIGVLDLIQILSGFHFPEIVIKIALMLAYFNPAVNPPIYAASIEHYRKAFIRLLVCSKWLNSVRSGLHSTRANSYKNSCVGNKSSPTAQKSQPLKTNLTVPSRNGRSGKANIMQSTTSEFDGSLDDLSYDDTTAIGAGLSTLGRSSEKSLKSALYSSATTLLSIVFSEEEIDHYLLDPDGSRGPDSPGESSF